MQLINRFACPNLLHKGRFVMYSGITKIYYRKTAGHVFTKPIQIEGTTQKIYVYIQGVS